MLLRKLAGPLLGLIALVLLARFLLLPWMGQLLIRNDEPCNGDAILVLAGGFVGTRTQKAVELFRKQHAPQLILSGAQTLYGVPESELSKQLAVRLGMPSEAIRPIQHGTRSTRRELQLLLPKLKREGIERLILVTSDFHTFRSGWIAEHIENAPQVCLVPSDSFSYRAEFWKDREATETAFYEWVRLLNTWREYATSWSSQPDPLEQLGPASANPGARK